jgi:hypothetical protein
MEDFWTGIGIAFIIIALCVGFKGCDDTKRPLWGPNGSIIDTNSDNE